MFRAASPHTQFIFNSTLTDSCSEALLEDDTLATAEAGADRQKWQVCEANYFTGEDALLHHQRTTAPARLKTARDGCPKGDGAYAAALVELKRLGGTATTAQ